MRSEGDINESTDEETPEDKHGRIKPMIPNDNWQKLVNHVKLDRIELNKLVMDYLIKQGMAEAANIFQQEAEISVSQKELNCLQLRSNVRKELQNKRYDKAIEILREKTPILLDKTPTEYNIKLLKMLDCLKSNQKKEALFIAQTEISSIKQLQLDNTLREEVKRVSILALLKDYSNLPPDLKPFIEKQFEEERVKKVDEAILNYTETEKTPRIKKFLKHLRICQIKLRPKLTFPEKLDYRDSFCCEQEGNEEVL